MTTLTTLPGLPQETVGTPSKDATVVLYTATGDSQIATKTLSALRECARRQGWAVTQELYDLAPLGTPRCHRTAWRAVEHALTQGEAMGVVAPAEHEIAWHAAERTALRAWLLSVPAFALFTQAAQPPVRRAYQAASAAVGAAVAREWSRQYELHPHSLRRVRTDAFTFLTALGWPGSVVAAVGVLDRLARNAVIHAVPVGAATARMDVLLAVAEDDELRIDVCDPLPAFPDSTDALNGERGRGLRDVRRMGADLSWSLSEDALSKTIRARMVPGEVPL